MICNGQHEGVCDDTFCYHTPGLFGNEGPRDPLKAALGDTQLWIEIRNRIITLLSTEPDLILRTRLLGVMEAHWTHAVPRQEEVARLEHRLRREQEEVERRGRVLKEINANMAALRKTMVY